MSKYAYSNNRGFGGLISVRDPSITAVSPVAMRSRIVTLLEPPLRSRIESAVRERVQVVHANDLPAASSFGNRNELGTLLVSPSMAKPGWNEVLKEFLISRPGFVAVAIIRDDAIPVPDVILRLGTCGVQAILNLSRPRDWEKLRSIVNEPNGEAAATIVEHFRPILGAIGEDAERFFLYLIRWCPNITSVRQLSRKMSVNPQTLTSRFCRARLPSVKFYLAAFRLLHATFILRERRSSIANASSLLFYSSPQSFSRHVKSFLGVSASNLKDLHGFEGLLRNVLDRLFLPHQSELRTLRPYGLSRDGWL